MPSIPVSPLGGLKEVAASYTLIFCDIWGVLHNGISVFSQAPAALKAFRTQAGGKVVLVTNAPRPDWWVREQLNELGVPSDSYDAIVTSGDVTRHAIAEHAGKGTGKIFALGPEKDQSFYDGLPVELVAPDKADLVSVTGLLDDENETPADYTAMLEKFLARDLTMICANPDLMVERGDRLLYCGGALADKYARMGGRALLFGKPHAPIYVQALAMGQALLGRNPGKNEVLAIGDGIGTDVKGANDAGIDCLFITGGIHSAEEGPLAEATAENVARFLADKSQKAKAFMPRLVW